MMRNKITVVEPASGACLAPRLQTSMTRRAQSGQSLVELVVVSLFLVPMFMLIPILGKYINIKQNTIEASRAAAWEATVTPLHEEPEKAVIQNKIRTRFFANPGDPIVSDAQAPDGDDATPNPLMLTMSGQHLLHYKYIELSKLENNQSPAHLDQGLSYLNKIEDAVNTVSNGWYDLKFPPNPNGYYDAEVTTKVADLHIPNTVIGNSGAYLQPFDHLGLEFKAHTVLLTDAWSANGPGKPPTLFSKPAPRSVRKTVGVLVPTNALLPPKVRAAIKLLTDVIGILPFFHSFHDLDIGHIAPDVVPVDRLRKYHAPH